MNISYKWLKEYIDFTLTPEELAAALTSIGLETGSVEKIESIRGGLRGIVIGKVLTCVDHPDSDHLHITTVDLGTGEPVQIVCGAPNVAAGQTVVVATVGTTLYDGDKTFQIKKSKIRGIESFGMICAEDEIGVGSSHDGIIVIDPAKGIAPGTPAAEYYNLTDDYVLEVDLTPNRIDAASHYGVARDLKAWLDTHAVPTSLRRPDVEAFKVDDPAKQGIEVTVDAPDACIRYSGVTVRDVKVAESPQWLKDRLNAIGLHPINNIVDITNYLLHSFCQPLHCFDAAQIKGGKIIVRKAGAPVKFTTLDGVERTLDPADLVIANAEEPMCIAGVFGGLDSGVTDSTTDIFLESACFNPTSVRRTARRHGLNTDSSFRFERGVDPNNTLYVLKLAALMVKELGGGEIVGEVSDIYPEPVKPFPVTLSYSYLNNLVGKDIPRDVVDAILASLEIETAARHEDAVDLLVPTYRVDVQRPCDVVEDVLRIYGYNNIEMPGELHASLSYKSPTDAADDLRRIIAEQLTAQGFNEILNNSLTPQHYYEGLESYPADHCVTLLNPLSQDLNAMRQTLLFGGLESLAHNINRKNPDLMLYETGNVYFLNPALQPTAEAPLAPYSESARLALWLTGNIQRPGWNRKAEEASYHDMRAIVENILARLGVPAASYTFNTDEHSDIYAASQTLVSRSGQVLGTLGIVAPAIARKCDVKQTVIFAELDWDRLVKLALKTKVTFSPLPKTQPVKRDLALLVDDTVTFDRIAAVVRKSEKHLLRSVTLFDVYEGKNLPQGKKSYAINITLQDSEKTLQDKYIDNVMQRIIDNLKKEVAAELR